MASYTVKSVRRAALGLVGVACALLAFPLGSYGRSTAGNTWSGTWSRAEDGVAGSLILVQSGNSVSGHYTWNDGSGRVSGTVSGATFTGGFNETHYQGSFVLTLAGKTFTGSYTGKNKDTNGPISGPFDGTCIAGPCLQNGAPPPPPPPPPSSTAFTQLHVTASTGTNYFHKGGTPADAWYPIGPDTVLKPGDEITTEPDGEITMAFADNSKVTLSNLTAFNVGSFFTEGGVTRVEILLKMGEVAAKVHKSEATKSDFRIKSPTGTISVRGTKFSASYDPGSRTSIAAVTEHSVVVTPAKRPKLAVTVPAGKEVEFTATSVSPLAPLGKANAHGGIDRAKAYQLAAAAVGKAAKACALTRLTTTAGISVKPAGPGWLVMIPVVGNVKGPSSWTAAGSTATPVNAVAKQLAAGCQGIAPTTSATVTFSHAGTAFDQPIAAPQSANDLEANVDPHTGAIASAYWTKDGKSLGAAATVPAGADGLVFTTSPGANPGTPAPRPAGATGFHVFWNASGAITSATWTRVGKPLAAIPVTSGQKAIAISNGS